MQYKNTTKISEKFILIWLMSALAVAANANVVTMVPEENAGPPAYSQIQGTPGPADEPYFIPHDEKWAAIPFLRDTACVPPDFNLLDFNDFTPAFPGGPPRPIICPLTVEGFAIWRNGPPPIDMVPIFSQLHGTGGVPVWFVDWNELQGVLGDGDLTLTELVSMQSLMIGYADYYKETVQPGINRPQGPGNGKIQITATGFLPDGRSFQMSVREAGVDGDSIQRHTQINIR